MPARKAVKAHVGASVAREPAAAYGGPAGEVVLYQAPDGTVTLDVRLDRETIWLSLNQMASLFGRDKSVVSRHLGKIFSSKELERDSVVALYATTASDGKTYQVEYFNLDAVISVGYRVNSKRGTQFRIWATRVLGEHVLRGYTVNERRLTELKQAVRLVADLSQRTTLGGDEASAGSACASWPTSKIACIRQTPGALRVAGSNGSSVALLRLRGPGRNQRRVRHWGEDRSERCWLRRGT